VNVKPWPNHTKQIQRYNIAHEVEARLTFEGAGGANQGLSIAFPSLQLNAREESLAEMDGP